jgi:hypothetical protein
MAGCAEDCAIRRSVRPRGSQSLSPYPGTAAPTHTVCKEDVDLYYRGREYLAAYWLWLLPEC